MLYQLDGVDGERSSVRWEEVEYVGGKVECVGQERDPRLQIEARLDEAL